MKKPVKIYLVLLTLLALLLAGCASGQKSAEEVARLIQNKANIYVNEQR